MGSCGFVVGFFTQHFVQLFLLFGLCARVVRVQNPDKPSEENDYLVLPAAGRTVSLGSLYDSKAQKFSTVNIFKRKPTPEIVTTIDRPYTDTKFSLTNTLSQRAHLLQVNAELSLGLKGGQIQGGVSGEFLRDTLTKSNGAKGTLKFTSNTKQQMVEIFFEEAKQHISTQILEKKLGTHVVIGIDFGSHMLLTFEDSNQEDKEQDKIAAALELGISGIKNVSVNVSGSFNNTDSELSQLQNFDFNLQGELNLDDSYPTSLPKILDLIVKFPDLVKSANEGKGAQQAFYLLPLETLRRWMTPTAPPQNTSSQSCPYTRKGEGIQAEETMAALLTHELADALQVKVDNLAAEMDKYRDHIKYDVHVQLVQLRSALGREQYKLSQNLGEITASERNCKGNGSSTAPPPTADIPSHRENWTRVLNESREALQGISLKFETEFRVLQLKFRMISGVKRLGGLWQPRSEQYTNKLIHEGTKLDTCKYQGICALRYKNDYNVNDLFVIFDHTMAATRDRYLPIVIDCDFVENEDFLKPCTDPNFGDTCRVVIKFETEPIPSDDRLLMFKPLSNCRTKGENP